MSTTVDYVLTRLRLELQDDVEPYFWSDTELIYYIDEGQREFCRPDFCPIRDSKSKEVTEIRYKANDYELPLHPSILRILTVIREDSNSNLHKIPLITQENVVSLYPARRPDYGTTIDGARALNRASDQFEVFVDYDEGYLRLSSPALTAGTLLLMVDRLPINDLKQCDDPLEIRKEYVPALIAWAAFRAWNKQDAETFDEQAAQRSYSLFRDHAERARIDQRRRTSQPGTVKYGGI